MSFLARVDLRWGERERENNGVDRTADEGGLKGRQGEAEAETRIPFVGDF